LNSKNTLRPLLILFLATIVATTQPSSAIVPDKGPNASGEGRFTSFFSEQIDFSFHVKVNKNGKGKGWAQFDNLSDQTHVVIKINCVNIRPFDVATMSGTVQHSDDPAFPKDATVVFTATDEDSPFGDRITPLVVEEELDCEFDVLGLRLIVGDIRIEP
jgi:hypothetical protein